MDLSERKPALPGEGSDGVLAKNGSVPPRELLRAVEALVAQIPWTFRDRDRAILARLAAQKLRTFADRVERLP